MFYYVILSSCFFIEKWGKDVYAPFAMRLTDPPVCVMRGCGCVGVWVPGSAPHTYTFDKRVYICCLAASCRKRYIVRHNITSVNGSDRAVCFLYAFVLCSYCYINVTFVSLSWFVLDIIYYNVIYTFLFSSTAACCNSFFRGDRLFFYLHVTEV